MQRWATDAQIAFMNPGGLRADMVGTVVDQAYLDAHPESTAKIGDRILTYKQAAVVQPFANTLNNIKAHRSPDQEGARAAVAAQRRRDAAHAAVPAARRLRRVHLHLLGEAGHPAERHRDRPGHGDRDVAQRRADRPGHESTR
ncbi:hypothetical protein G5V59_02135 [Nocardioides sp. W3-2-3]|uniref:hypothetical protein n=1 Tax=Nocardioides convexus TaxID=2712224 RepID=UPI002418B8B6|nr:hypothetical protein [Nocardioides convexus]NGZ99586.1 hypothetical protein [Nocardioides convexus]